MHSSSTSSRSPVRGQVATVFKARQGIEFFQQQLAINVGSEHGVSVGTQFDVLDDEVQVTDPKSGETLGSVSTTKGRVKVTTVSELFSVAVVVGNPNSLFSEIGNTFIDNLEVGDRVVEVRS